MLMSPIHSIAQPDGISLTNPIRFDILLVPATAITAGRPGNLSAAKTVGAQIARLAGLQQ